MHSEICNCVQYANSVAFSVHTKNYVEKNVQTLSGALFLRTVCSEGYSSKALDSEVTLHLHLSLQLLEMLGEPVW